MATTMYTNPKSTLRPDVDSHPVYELRATGLSGGEMELELWQLPSPSTPRLKQAEWRKIWL